MKRNRANYGHGSQLVARGQRPAVTQLSPHRLIRPRILIADDDSVTAELLGTISQREGYDVEYVADGRQAFRLLQADSRFSLVIFNGAMPHLNATEIIQYMKTEKRLMGIPAVLISAGDKLNVVAQAFAAGAIAVLPKPFDADQLQRIVQLALKARAGRQVLRAA